MNMETKQEIELLPCPFCGGNLRRNMWGAFEDDNKECILYGFEMHEKLIPAWNTRKPIENIVAELERCKDENLLMSRKFAKIYKTLYKIKAQQYEHAIFIVEALGGWKGKRK